MFLLDSFSWTQYHAETVALLSRVEDSGRATAPQHHAYAVGITFTIADAWPSTGGCLWLQDMYFKHKMWKKAQEKITQPAAPGVRGRCCTKSWWRSVPAMWHSSRWLMRDATPSDSFAPFCEFIWRQNSAYSRIFITTLCIHWCWSPFLSAGR